jgi:hypothetical protein
MFSIVDRLTYILDVSLASENKSVPVGLAAAVAADPRCAVVAQTSFWRLYGGSSVTPLGIKHALTYQSMIISITYMFIITCNIS